MLWKQFPQRLNQRTLRKPLACYAPHTARKRRIHMDHPTQLPQRYSRLHRQNIFMDDLSRICTDKMNPQYLSGPPSRNNLTEPVRLAFGNGSVNVRLVKCEHVNIPVFLACFCLGETTTCNLWITKGCPRHNSIVDCVGKREKYIPKEQLRLKSGNVCE